MSIRRGGSTRLFDINVEYVAATPKAVCYNDGKKDFWVPRSQLEHNGGDVQIEERPDGTFTLTAPERWLTEKGLV